MALQVGAWVQVEVHVSSSAPKCRQHDPIVWFCYLKPLLYSPVWSGEGDAYSSPQKLHARLPLHPWAYISYMVPPGDSPFLGKKVLVAVIGTTEHLVSPAPPVVPLVLLRTPLESKQEVYVVEPCFCLFHFMEGDLFL